MIFPAESDTITGNLNRMVKISEGLYRSNVKQKDYARFWGRGKRIQQKLTDLDLLSFSLR
jgi:hypothetical protein